ncbi:hypothetical protein GpartN1_g3969.t1 [Galdieria partita]|uniref:Coenzyme Q-binding protein COQ10 START domain-containing protein n=1 Tax=Galdieria partita TaxID=83374 RepID=A0A9C7PWM2_9RHOD|nr:hypothetical protein GpartN1_g3969.t1 [Galdieria partita]
MIRGFLFITHTTRCDYHAKFVMKVEHNSQHKDRKSLRLCPNGLYGDGRLLGKCIESLQPRTLCCHFQRSLRRYHHKSYHTVALSKERLSSEAIPKNGDVIIERPTRNRRTIICGLVVCANMKALWDLLTDYEHLADFIPNLSVSRLRYHPQGGIRLEQEGVQSVLGFRFRASVILDMYEKFSEDKAEIDFVLADSQDFDLFEGSWLMYPLKRNWTHLIYQVTVQPKRFVPVQAVEWRIREDVPTNLQSIKSYIESLSQREG